ncbi:MAG TPA: ATP-dependent protease ATPase subunit HslU [Candidatus Marinimicrobia bacterium]|nr:ATP-dependent protease ATPase subunit HslU [Candidatus Neomarinimicrobiota bacterium]HQQ85948.1 ATP-dependent protease ATPase subunit HslU [Candidatus Neomarinimicrobiota bacterium]
MKNRELTPREIVRELDAYIIGQEKAKKAVAIAMRNRWRRQHVRGAIKEDILPNNIILIGPTGIGKTEIARRLSNLAGAPFIKVEASKFTEVGYVGRDVESIIRDLTGIAVTMVKNERMAEVNSQALFLANERILDILLPSGETKHHSEQEEIIPRGDEKFNRTREKLRVMLENGEMEDRLIEITVNQGAMPMMQIFGPAGIEEMEMNLSEMLGSAFPQKKKIQKVTISEARKIFTQEEAQKLIDMETVVREAVQRVEETGIVFIDEIDKIASSGDQRGYGPDVSREGVQRDILPIVEGSNVQTKYGVVRTDHILFIAAGAFHATKPSDLIPELQGRFPIRVEMDSLGKDEFVKILKNPRNALLKQYTALLKTEKVDLIFDDDAVEEIAQIAAEVNEKMENIGARRLHTILTTLLEEILYKVPDKDIREVHITREFVQARLQNIVRDRDLSRYIL